MGGDLHWWFAAGQANPKLPGPRTTKRLLLYPAGTMEAIGGPLEEGDICPLPWGKTAGLAIGLLKSELAILLTLT